MKKKLKLGKKSITELNFTKATNVKGGGFTAGCTDGCSPFNSMGNCTNANCTADCPKPGKPNDDITGDTGFSSGGC